MSTTTTQTISPPPSPQIKELKNGFGVEIEGLDLADGVREETFQLLQGLLVKVRNLPTASPY